MENYTPQERKAILTYLEKEKRRIEIKLSQESCQGIQAHFLETYLEIVRNHTNQLLNR